MTSSMIMTDVCEIHVDGTKVLAEKARNCCNKSVIKARDTLICVIKKYEFTRGS